MSPTPPPPAAAAYDSPDRLIVLVIDDEAADREVIRRLLAPGAEIELVERSDAGSGLAALQSERVDAVLLDYSLPGKDGAVVLREAVAAGVEAPILVLTGHGDEQLAVELLRGGASDYLPKSALDSADLLARVRQMVKVHRAERVAAKAAQALQDRGEFEQQLIGLVSHDLRNPLSTIRLSAQVLRARNKDDQQRAVIERILRATTQADRMIRDLVDFTQVRLGAGIPIEAGPVDLHATVRQVLAELAVLHPDREADVRHGESGAGKGTWDPARVAQLATNLVNNAFQLSVAGTPVEVATAVDGGTAILRVANQGPPIPADVLPRIFEPLRRGRSLSSGTTAGSTGLGLFISQEIARAHGGRIDVVSDERGTIFTARLPAAVAGAGQPPPPAGSAHG